MSLNTELMKRMRAMTRSLQKASAPVHKKAAREVMREAQKSAAQMPAFVSDLLAQLGVGPQVAEPPVKAKKPAPAAPSAGAATPRGKATALPGEFKQASFTSAAGTRAYKVYVPASADGRPLPLLVMLHGCTQDPDDFAAGTGMNLLAEEKQCVIVYPAQSASANHSRCWNWFNAIDQQRGQGEPAIIAGITEEVITQYAIDRRQVFVAGMSAGGAMAIILGTTYPELYAAVGVHSGLPYAAAHDLPSAMAAMRGQGKKTAGGGGRAIPIIVFHGDRDTTVNADNGEQLMAQSLAGMRAHGEGDIGANALVQNGKVPGGHAYTTSAWLDSDGNPVAEHWVIHGEGHAWSGGSRSGSYTDPLGPDASREMLRFFKTQGAQMPAA